MGKCKTPTFSDKWRKQTYPRPHYFKAPNQKAVLENNQTRELLSGLCFILPALTWKSAQLLLFHHLSNGIPKQKLHLDNRS